MLNLMNNAKPWMVASLLVATSVFGQDAGRPAARDCKPCNTPAKNCAPACPTPTPPTQMCQQPASPCCAPWPVPVLNAAYNYPARTLTRCPWDVYFDASFIYWQPIEEGVSLGAVNGSGASTAGSGTVNNPSFKPGFKVGIGGNFDYDNWDMHAEYTWFHNTQTSSATATGTDEIVDPITGGDYTSVSQTWNLKMDLADLDLGRWHYTGTKFTARPSVGLRGAWIRQTRTLTGTGTESNTATQKSTSWGVGPKVAVDTNWMIGEGFRFFGDAEADILYTRYNNISTSVTGTTTANNGSTSESHLDQLRTHVDLELGFAWGTYIDCNNWYLDIALGYGFQVFFDQNMFRNIVDRVPHGNLYVNGLTAAFRLDF